MRSRGLVTSWRQGGFGRVGVVSLIFMINPLVSTQLQHTLRSHLRVRMYNACVYGVTYYSVCVCVCMYVLNACMYLHVGCV